MLLLAIFGLVLLATPALRVGLLLIWLAWRGRQAHNPT